MDHQAERLGLIVEAAEQSMDIVQRFSNDPIGAGNIQTASGPIKNLKQVSADITSDGQLAIGVAVTELIAELKAETSVSALIDGLTDSAVVASNNAAIAVVAAEHANATGKIYDSTAIGLVSTANGQYFSVPSPDNLENLILYKNNAGVALDTGKRSPNAPVTAIARRGNYVLSGRATKVEKIAGTSDYLVSWGRLYIFTGTGKAQAYVQAVTDVTVPNGKCAYVDLAAELVGGEYVVQVSELPLATTANPPGSYIDDSKIILFTCLNGIIGGVIHPQYHAVADGAVGRVALDISLKNMLDRGSWNVAGKATKLQPLVSTPSTYQISFPELTITGAQTFSAKRVAPATDVIVPAGEAMYVDLDGDLNGSDQLVAQVTSGGYTAGMLANGAFITDRKVYLFVNDKRGIAGPLAQQQITFNFIDQSLKNRANRPAYVVMGDLTRYLESGTACVMSFGDLRITRGIGNTTVVVAGLADVSVARGQALYVDLSAALVDGKLVPQLTTGGYSSPTGGLANGAFVDDNKLYLFINDAVGYGGALANRRPANPYLGEVWMKQAPNNVTFDPATRTLAWDNYLILPAIGGQGRIKLAPGSFTFSSTTLNVAYLDMLAVVTTGDTPATAVKGGTYHDGAVADRFRGQSHQLPMFYWNGASDYGPLCGFPRASEPVGTVVSTLAQDDVVVKTSANAVSAFVKGAKSSSLKYLEQTIGYENRPFDPTGADAYGNSDLWRLKHQYECDLTTSSTSFVRARGSQPLLNGGELEMAALEDGMPDYMGGFHGDEIKTFAALFLDGVQIPFNTVATYVGKKLTLVQNSRLYRCNTQVEVATHVKRVTLSREDGGLKIAISQQVVWSKSLVLKAAMLTMLPIKRLIKDTTGEVITNTAMRAPYTSIEDVSATGFAQVTTLGSLPDAQLWGPTGISASVQILKHPGLPSCGFYIASAVNYNKFYYSVAGSTVSTMGGTTHTTQPGEAWDVESVIRMTTNL
ncbi:hypothetical protein [Pseudomonas sp.]|uniref:hypothetical protein n=1 Tax=Pseudomonas sp. TaxID=306 RepID=UPI00262BCBB0|nr:hypothetical protein [Pseudomonas sp.]